MWVPNDPSPGLALAQTFVSTRWISGELVVMLIVALHEMHFVGRWLGVFVPEHAGCDCHDEEKAETKYSA
jgi:hypothetical protein